MTSKKKILYGLLLLVTLVVLTNWNLIIYGISQARGQLEIVYNSQPIEVFLNDNDFPDSLKNKLRLIPEIKRFAFDSLGINYSENYSTMYNQKGKPLMFVVSACEPFKLEQKKWNFPFLGSFSYKGFFNKGMAGKLEEELKNEGLDTNIRTAGGWSTLGWFKDPILSGMLKRGEGQLAELIIHELTHGTLFVKDSLKFNENLASFVGENGALLFLKNHYGENSEYFKIYQQSLSDDELFKNYVLKWASKLDSTYGSFTAEMTVNEKLNVKTSMIKEFKEDVDNLNLNNKSRFVDFLNRQEINNTFFMSYIRYGVYQNLLKEELASKFNGDIKVMLKSYKQKYPSL